LYKLVATIPCHNEAEFLEEAVNILKKEIEPLENNYLIVIAEDGSTDGSDIISKRLAFQERNFLHIHADNKLGRGQALMNAWSKLEGEIYAYIDCDLATDMRFFPYLIRSIYNGYDLATGSRYLRGSNCRRPILRRLSSIAYNFIIRLLFGDGVYDHQCGFKAFSRRMVEFLIRECKSGNWFWDTEAIVLAYRNRFKILEFPVIWEEKKGKRTPLKRLLKDVWIHGCGIFLMLKRV